jgi:hypothetical protein
MSLAIGWTLEGKTGLVLYDHFASKERFAREMLGQKGLSADVIAAIPQGEAFGKLVEMSGQTKEAITQALYVTHNVGVVWYIMGAVGVVTAIGIYSYGRWVIGVAKRPVET